MSSTVLSERYQYTFFENGYLFTVTGRYEKFAKHLFCKKAPKPIDNMVFLVKLPNLETIDAKSCGITNINYDIHSKAGEESLHLYRLHSADFSHNKIETIRKHCFYSLQYGLKTLNLSNNNIKNLAKDAFYDLKNLEILDLTNNNITDIKPNSFNDFNHLKNFYLANNRLRILHFQLFYNSQHLQIMNFSSNQIENITYPKIVWRKMKTLDLSNNMIHQMSSECFPNLHKPNLSETPEKAASTDNQKIGTSILDFLAIAIISVLVGADILSSICFAFKGP
jgi:Leucine rich repeat